MCARGREPTPLLLTTSPASSRLSLCRGRLKRGVVRHGPPFSRPKGEPFMRILITTAMAAALPSPCPLHHAAAEEAGEPPSLLASLTAPGPDPHLVRRQSDEYSVTDGSYSCASCIPPLTFAADGQYPPVPTGPITQLAVGVDDRTIGSAARRRPQNVRRHQPVSADGNTLTTRFTNFDGGAPGSGTSTSTRLGPAPPDDATSASGRPTRSRYTEESLDISFQIEGTRCFELPGQTYVATWAAAVAIDGDTGGTMSRSSRRQQPEETYLRDGRRRHRHYHAEPDGRRSPIAKRPARWKDDNVHSHRRLSAKTAGGFAERFPSCRAPRYRSVAHCFVLFAAIRAGLGTGVVRCCFLFLSLAASTRQRYHPNPRAQVWSRQGGKTLVPRAARLPAASLR